MPFDFLDVNTRPWTVHTTAGLRELLDGDWLTREVGVCFALSDGDGVVLHADTFTALADALQRVVDDLRTAAVRNGEQAPRQPS